MDKKYRLSDFYAAKEIKVTDTENEETYTLTIDIPLSSLKDALRELKITDGVFGTVVLTISNINIVDDIFFNMTIGSPFKVPFANSELIIKHYEVEIIKKGKVVWNSSNGSYELKDEESKPKTDE